MLSRKENEKLTRLGPGTPAGELLRRYWQPVCVAAELKENPIKRIRILGEDLVLYRGEDGQYGLVEERCPHRGPLWPTAGSRERTSGARIMARYLTGREDASSSPRSHQRACIKTACASRLIRWKIGGSPLRVSGPRAGAAPAKIRCLGEK